MKTKKEIKQKIKHLESEPGCQKSPRRRSKIMALEWVLGNVSNI
jgi:hypothetical protein